MFKVKKTACESCIYRKGSPLNLAKLEAEIADPKMKGFFKGHRACHKHTMIDKDEDVCCRGFWERHKDKFQMGQLAQRFGIVQEIE